MRVNAAAMLVSALTPWESDGCTATGLLVQETTSDTIPWAIRLADMAWGSAGLPSELTYGVVPSGAIQTEPTDGPALPLVSGREYLVMITTRSGDVGFHNSWLTTFVQP